MEVPRHWRLKKQRYCLEGEVLPCGHKVFPPRPTCPICQHEKWLAQAQEEDSLEELDLDKVLAPGVLGL